MKPWGKTLTRKDEAKKAMGFHFESIKPCCKCGGSTFYTSTPKQCVKCHRAMQKKHYELRKVKAV